MGQIPILKQLFELRGTLPKKTRILCEAIGTLIIIGIWLLITEFELVPVGILPSPIKIVLSFGELHFEDALVRNAAYSFYLNTLGCLEAILFAIPLGFVIGLFPGIRSVFERYIGASRFLPLTAVVGLFVAWFGIYTNMKIQFLAFSIFIFLLPAVIARVDETKEVYVQTAKTLGATKWQQIRTVFMPSVLSSVYEDIRLLAALSWTYIIVAELVNTSGGGIGALAYIASRQSRTDKVYAVLIVILLIGFVQDKILTYANRRLFPYKFVQGGD